MVAPIRFLSGRQQQQKIGIEGSTENQKVLEVIGQVGIGTTIFEPSEQLDVRGSVSVADTITASTINATTVVVTGSGSTFSDLTVTGIATFNSDIDANAGLDVDGHTELDSLNVSGLSTFGQLACRGLGSARRCWSACRPRACPPSAPCRWQTADRQCGCPGR